jgi:predicted transcriptional regulator
MRKSKLERYEEILSTLVDKYLNVESIASEGKMDTKVATKLLDFLEKNGLVEKTNRYKKTLYSLTSRGEAVFRTLTITKRLNKLKESIETKEAKPTIPTLAK